MIEHAVFVHVPVRPEPPVESPPSEWTRHGDGWTGVQEELVKAARELGGADVEEFDFACGEAVFYLYGRDADLLLGVAVDVLRRFPALARPYAVVRRGAFTDPDATEDYLDLADVVTEGRSHVRR